MALLLFEARLPDFDPNKTRKWELRDVSGYIVEFSGDQHGSRLTQEDITATGPYHQDRSSGERSGLTPQLLNLHTMYLLVSGFNLPVSPLFPVVLDSFIVYLFVPLKRLYVP